MAITSVTPSVVARSSRSWKTLALVCSSSDGQNWSVNTALHESSSGNPTLSVFNNRLWVSFIANNSTNTVLVCSSADGQTWTGNVQV